MNATRSQRIDTYNVTLPGVADYTTHRFTKAELTTIFDTTGANFSRGWMYEALKTEGVQKNPLRAHDDPRGERVYTIYEVLCAARSGTRYWQNRCQAIENLLERMGYPRSIPITHPGANGRVKQAPKANRALINAFTGDDISSIELEGDEFDIVVDLLSLVSNTKEIWTNLPFTDEEKNTLGNLYQKMASIEGTE